MKIVYIAAGSGRMECDACLRDAALAKVFKDRGHEALFVPTYTPLVTDEARRLAAPMLFYGGINVYLRHRFPFFRGIPSFFTRVFDNRWLLGLATRLGDMTNAKSLADLTISVLEGEDGPQRGELRRLLDWLKTQIQPDLIVLPNTLFAGLASSFHEAFGAPVFALLSGEDAFVELFPEPHRSRTHRVLRRRAAELDGFIAPNRYYAEFMTRYLDLPPEKVRVVPLGVDVSEFPEKKPPAPDVFTIGYRSPICPGNGLHLLIEAFRLLKSNPETARCRLRCAGFLGGGDKRYFRDAMANVRNSGLEKDFEYIGQLEPRDRAAFLSGLSVLCVPTVYPEPSGMFVAEALAAHVPVVLPKSGCLEEWIRETGGGILVEPKDPLSAAEAADPELLAEGIARIMRDPAEAARLAESGRRAVVSRFSLDAMAEGMLSIFADSLKD